MKIKKTLNKKQRIIMFGALVLVVPLVVAVGFVCNRPKDDAANLESIENIEVTEAEMQEYRERIGTDMDIKKSYLILFEDDESCREFIESHGAADDPTALGIGIIPLMEDGYYNIVGKQSLEDAFDLLGDGEYSKEPVIYSDMYCYLKRICIESPIKDDAALKELIRNDKYHKLKKAGD